MLLHIPPRMWHRFREAMLEARFANEEVIGFFFCTRHQVSKSKIRFLPKAWVVPDPDCYERQSAGGLALKQQFHLYLLQTYVNNGLDVVHIHTHPGHGIPRFSYTDDEHESRYAKFLSSSFEGTPRLISGVFDELLEHSSFRIWDKDGQSVDSSLKFCNSSVEASTSQDIDSWENALIFDRQRVFGDRVQKQLGELSVGLIGCGGIGSVFAEVLSRLGVRKWVLIDPDRLEETNLNRMPSATYKMAKGKWYKVRYVKELIKRMYPRGSYVRAMPVSIQDDKAKREIASCDLIVVGTDNHISRQIAQEIALKYMRPLLCLGTYIEARPKESHPRMYCRITLPPLDGGWCLMCGNIINLQRAALESSPQDITEIAARAGYIEGVADPAVFWLNSICASKGVGVIHGMLSGFLNLDSGIDWVYDFPGENWLKTNTQHLGSPTCYFCSIEGEYLCSPDL